MCMFRGDVRLVHTPQIRPWLSQTAPFDVTVRWAQDCSAATATAAASPPTHAAAHSHETGRRDWGHFAQFAPGVPDEQRKER